MVKVKKAPVPTFGSIATSPTTGFTPSSPAFGVSRPVSGSSTTKDTTTQPIVPAQPALQGTFTDVSTGRKSGVATPRGTFFGLHGSDLELLQQQMQAKESQGNFSGGNMQGTIAQAAQAREAVGNLPIPSDIQIGNVGTPGFGISRGNLFQAQETSKIIEKLAAGKELSPEEINVLGLNDLDMKLIKQGEIKVNKLGQILESVPIGKRKLPFIGISLASWISDTPSEQVDELLKTIDSNVDLANTYLIAAQTNPFAKARYMKLVDNINQQILELESKVKLQTIQSPELRANPEKVTDIENRISIAKESLAGPAGVLNQFSRF